jgi:hypothetical protein
MFFFFFLTISIIFIKKKNIYIYYIFNLKKIIKKEFLNKLNDNYSKKKEVDDETSL